jgi:hypothetical protein
VILKRVSMSFAFCDGPDSGEIRSADASGARTRRLATTRRRIERRAGRKAAIYTC